MTTLSEKITNQLISDFEEQVKNNFISFADEYERTDYLLQYIADFVDGNLHPVIGKNHLTLSGLYVAITGSLSVSRKEMQKVIESRGGHYQSSVNSKTDILLHGDKPGRNKLDDAAYYGVPILTEMDFCKKYMR